MKIAEKYINPFTDFGRFAARFKKLFGTEPNKDLSYESSLKYYRDLKNVIDTAEDEGERKGVEKTINKVAIEMLKEGENISKIAKYTGLTEDEIESIRASL